MSEIFWLAIAGGACLALFALSGRSGNRGSDGGSCADDGGGGDSGGD